MISGTPREFALDPILVRDNVVVGDLPLTRVLMSTDANYPWLTLVPRRAAVTELADLPATERVTLMEEIVQVSVALKAITGCDKINVATLGNVVAQIHVHVVARFHKDGNWPKPPWGLPRQEYAPAARDALLAAVRQRLNIGP
ncbi:MAG: HIT domain-containing protein [Pseudolabrys sp.]|nr:HIT domain-containing protein [Pseudolabrys sp.]MBV9261053.1 HIT domain-containing protein [Pseudolabrys sp.]